MPLVSESFVFVLLRHINLSPIPMKNIIRIVLTTMVVISVSTLNAQKAPKFGHINFAELFGMMPGQDTVQQKYQAYAMELRNTLDVMQAELEKKYTDYQANLATYSDIIKKTKEQEIQDLQARMESFQSSAQQDLQKKEEELTAPIIEKARKAIKDVAQEQGYTYIFNGTEGVLLFSDPADNVMDLVKKKLGIEK
jgi:outer membrane protein